MGFNGSDNFFKHERKQAREKLHEMSVLSSIERKRPRREEKKRRRERIL
jgi:hypothetical protein